MTGLREIRHIARIPDEPPRRWFSGDDLDLTVWTESGTAPGPESHGKTDADTVPEPGDRVLAWQLCHRPCGGPARAYTWSRRCGLKRHRIDDGENRPGRTKSAGILIPAGRSSAQASAQASGQAEGQAITDFDPAGGADPPETETSLLARRFASASRDMEKEIAAQVLRALTDADSPHSGGKT